MKLFHVGVLVLMAIPFFYQLSFVAFAPFFPVERLAAFARDSEVVKRWRSARLGLSGRHKVG